MATQQDIPNAIQSGNLQGLQSFGRNAATSAGIRAGANTLAGKSALAGAGNAFAIAAAIYAAYKMYQGVQSHRKLEKAGGITDAELRSSYDLLGTEALVNSKYVPKEAREIGKAILPGYEYMFNPVGTIADLGADVGLWGTKKNEDQVRRDRMRKALENAGAATMVDGSHHVELADGSLFNIGLDGDSTYQNFDPLADVDGSGAGVRKGYNVDASHPNAQQAVGFMNPYAFILNGGDDKLSSDSAGYLSSAVLSNAGEDVEIARQNALHLYERTYAPIKEKIALEQGIDPSQIDTRELALGSLQVLYDQGRITEEELAALTNGVNQVYGLAPLTPPGTEIEADPNNPDVYIEQKDMIAQQGPPGGVEVNPEMDTLGNPRPAPQPPSVPLEASPPLSSGIATPPPPEGLLKTSPEATAPEPPPTPEAPTMPTEPVAQPDAQSFADQYYAQVQEAQDAARAEAEAERQKQMKLSFMQQSPGYKMLQSKLSSTKTKDPMVTVGDTYSSILGGF